MNKSLRNTLLLLMLTASTALSGAANAPAPPALLLERARQGNAQAQLEAGFVFFKANNPVRAAYWFSAAARQNLPEAQYNLGRCCQTGYGVEKNQHRAFEQFQLAAQQNLAPAMLECAVFYLSGIEAAPDAKPPRKAVLPDEKQAFDLLEKLVQRQYTPAMIVYSKYLIKKYRNTHQEKIIYLLNTAAISGNAEAQLLLADYLLSCNDRFRDEVRARKLLEQASGRHPEARAKLAFAVEYGFGAPPQPEKAFKLYRQSLEESFSPLAATRLANYYFAGSCGVKQDIAQAVKLYTRAAEAGMPEAMARLGDCYRSGIGVVKDLNNAFNLYFQAAKLNYPAAAFALGRAFELGEGTPCDQQAAFYWYNQSAMRYDPRGMLETGKRYLQGNGTLPDAGKAVIFLEQAYANGMREAWELLQEARRKPQNANEIQPQKTPDFKL